MSNQISSSVCDIIICIVYGLYTLCKSVHANFTKHYEIENHKIILNEKLMTWNLCDGIIKEYENLCLLRERRVA
jgi:hypothetical protein